MVGEEGSLANTVLAAALDEYIEESGELELAAVGMDKKNKQLSKPGAAGCNYERVLNCLMHRAKAARRSKQHGNSCDCTGRGRRARGTMGL